MHYVASQACHPPPPLFVCDISPALPFVLMHQAAAPAPHWPASAICSWCIMQLPSLVLVHQLTVPALCLPISLSMTSPSFCCWSWIWQVPATPPWFALGDLKKLIVPLLPLFTCNACHLPSLATLCPVFELICCIRYNAFTSSYLCHGYLWSQWSLPSLVNKQPPCLTWPFVLIPSISLLINPTLD